MDSGTIPPLSVQILISRFLFVLMAFIINIALISDINFETTHVSTDKSPRRTIAAIHIMNGTFSRARTVPLSEAPTVTLVYAGILTDSRLAVQTSPVSETCKSFGTDCFSYVVPVGFSDLEAYDDMKYREVGSYTMTERGGATEYVVEGAMGYLLEFFPTPADLTFEAAECHNQSHGISMCLKNDGDDLISGSTLKVSY